MATPQPQQASKNLPRMQIPILEKTFNSLLESNPGSQQKEQANKRTTNGTTN